MLAKAYRQTARRASGVPVLAIGAETARLMQPLPIPGTNNMLNVRQRLVVLLRIVALVAVSDIGTSTMWVLQ